MLEKNRTCDDLHLKSQSRAHLVDIPLAGFVLGELFSISRED